MLAICFPDPLREDLEMGETYVLYVLNALLVAVLLGIGFGVSHCRVFVARSESSVGGLSTRYEIQACQPGSICAASKSCFA
jgi:hypothetical protein